MSLSIHTDTNLKIVVYGLWHLGCVTATSLASQRDFQITGLDPDEQVVAGLEAGRPPLFEPGLTELVAQGAEAGRLNFTTDPAQALAGARVVWVAFDTPVNNQDEADLTFIENRLEEIFSYIEPGTLVLISSQVAVGFTGRLAARWRATRPDRPLVFGYIPENLRLGNALNTFRAQDRFVAGLEDNPPAKSLLENILTRFCPRIEWMSVASAEMTKHALNSFLAVSVSLINEIARLCEQTGADAKEVERGLKSEMRIGPKAYLSPGGPFAGGTLARDLRFLTGLGRQLNVNTALLDGALASNEAHKGWVQAAIGRTLEGLKKPRVLICGVSYKAGTDTLRRSEAINLGLWLADHGVSVIFHDPVATELPADLARRFTLTKDLGIGLAGADVLVLATGWPQYHEELTPDRLIQAMRQPTVIDQNRYLVSQLGHDHRLRYISVGSPASWQLTAMKKTEAETL